MNTQDFNLYDNEVEAQFLDYDAGMEYARQHGKPVMVDFTGYGCVNCRKMELAVWSDQKVADIMQDDYVLISLYVDDKTKLPEPVKVTENGQGNAPCAPSATTGATCSAANSEPTRSPSMSCWTTRAGR